LRGNVFRTAEIYAPTPKKEECITPKKETLKINCLGWYHTFDDLKT